MKDIVLNPGDVLVIQADLRAIPRDSIQIMLRHVSQAISGRNQVLLLDQTYNLSKIQFVPPPPEAPEVQKPYHFRVMRLEEIVPAEQVVDLGYGHVIQPDDDFAPR